MTTKNWQELLNEARQAGALTNQTPAPEGRYPVEVVTAKEKDDRNGNPMVNARLVIIDGPERGKRFWNNFGFNPQNPDQFSVSARHLKAFGIDIEQYPTLSSICDALVGKRAEASLIVEEFRGEDRNSAQGFAPVQAVGAMPAPPTAPAAPAAPPAPPAAPVPPAAPAAAPVPPAPAPQPAPQPTPEPAPPAPAPTPLPAPPAPAPAAPLPPTGTDGVPPAGPPRAPF